MPISLKMKKFVTSLHVKKYRVQEQCFIVEGTKSILELVESDFVVREVFATPQFISMHAGIFKQKGIPLTEVTLNELQAVSSFKTNTSGLAVASMRINSVPEIKREEFALVLDDIRDPGNLGTIIRTADWYGITTVLASPESTDFYNPKVIASSMGSFTRVRIYYTDLVTFVGSYPGNVYGAFLDGKSVYEMDFSSGGLLVVGNESNGISKELDALIGNRITIPRVGHAESLNVATATAIILDNIRRPSR